MPAQFMDFMGRRIEMGSSMLGSALPHIKNGKLNDY
jgi:hypothetical protein